MGYIVDSSSYPDYENSQRNTRFFIPEKPKSFSMSVFSGNPFLSWSSNGETFPLKYYIYRRLYNKYGGTFSLFDSTTNTSYTDYDLAGAGSSGTYLVYYYLITKNATSGSNKISATTDTLDIYWNYWGYSKNIATVDLNAFNLYPNYPNPFNPSTEISYRLPSDDKVSLKIYNALGQEVRTLVNQTQSAGFHTVIWDGKNRYGQSVPSGIYLYRLQTKSHTKTMKMLMVK